MPTIEDYRILKYFSKDLRAIFLKATDLIDAKKKRKRISKKIILKIV